MLDVIKRRLRTREMRVTWAKVSLCALVVAGGCAADKTEREPSEAVEILEVDSGGLRTVQSSGNALEIALPWVVDSVPDLELGVHDGDGPLQFNRISGIVGLPDGGLIVLDGGSRELRWFDASGEHVRTLGGPGQGPGEFRNPHLVSQFHTDSLLIFDRRSRTFTWVAIDGSGARAVTPPDTGVQLFAGTPWAASGSRVLFSSLLNTDPCQENEHCEDKLLLRWVDVTGSMADTFALPHVRRVLNFRGSLGPATRLLGPLDQKGLAAVGPRGPVIEGRPEFELRQFDVGGRLIAIFRVDAPPRISPRDALDRFVQRYPDPAEARGVFQMLDLPEVVPAFQDLQVDHLGWYWANLFQPDEGGPSEWLVFDPEGRAHGIIELPPELEVHEIGDDYILGRWTDELGVEYVRRHTLDRHRI